MIKYMSTESNRIDWGYRRFGCPINPRLTHFLYPNPQKHQPNRASGSLESCDYNGPSEPVEISHNSDFQTSIMAANCLHLRILCLRMLMLYCCKCFLIDSNVNTAKVPVQVLSKFLAICKWYWSMQISLGNLWLYYNTPSLPLNSETLFWPTDCYRNNRLT